MLKYNVAKEYDNLINYSNSKNFNSDVIALNFLFSDKMKEFTKKITLNDLSENEIDNLYEEYKSSFIDDEHFKIAIDLFFQQKSLSVNTAEKMLRDIKNLEEVANIGLLNICNFLSKQISDESINIVSGLLNRKNMASNITANKMFLYTFNKRSDVDLDIKININSNLLKILDCILKNKTYLSNQNQLVLMDNIINGIEKKYCVGLEDKFNEIITNIYTCFLNELHNSAEQNDRWFYGNMGIVDILSNSGTPYSIKEEILLNSDVGIDKLCTAKNLPPELLNAVYISITDTLFTDSSAACSVRVSDLLSKLFVNNNFPPALEMDLVYKMLHYKEKSCEPTITYDTYLFPLVCKYLKNPEALNKLIDKIDKVYADTFDFVHLQKNLPAETSKFIIEKFKSRGIFKSNKFITRALCDCCRTASIDEKKAKILHDMRKKYGEKMMMVEARQLSEAVSISPATEAVFLKELLNEDVKSCCRGLVALYCKEKGYDYRTSYCISASVLNFRNLYNEFNDKKENIDIIKKFLDFCDWVKVNANDISKDEEYLNLVETLMQKISPIEKAYREYADLNFNFVDFCEKHFTQKNTQVYYDLMSILTCGQRCCILNPELYNAAKFVAEKNDKYLEVREKAREDYANSLKKKAEER